MDLWLPTLPGLYSPVCFQKKQRKILKEEDLKNVPLLGLEILVMLEVCWWKKLSAVERDVLPSPTDRQRG